MRTLATVFILCITAQCSFGSMFPMPGICSWTLPESSLPVFGRVATKEEVLIGANLSVQLTCSLPDGYHEERHPNVGKTVTWERVLKENNVSATSRFDTMAGYSRIGMNRFNDTTAQLVLQNARPHDTGKYRCIIYDTNTGQFGEEICGINVFVRPEGESHELNAVAPDSHSCTVRFEHDPAQFDPTHRVRYRKAGSGDKWAVVSKTLGDHAQRVQLDELDAGATYEIQVESRLLNTEDWSYPSQTECKTPSTVPGSPAGVIPGAFEQNDLGGMRTVTVYWKGVPKNRRNGRDFGYKVYTWFDGESPDRKTLQYTYKPSANNIVLYRMPSAVGVNVEIVPYNNMGTVPSEMVERVRIPAMQNPPLTVENVRVVNYSATEMEISWSVNRNASAFDLFFCPTSLLDLIMCADSMEHRQLSGDQLAVNFTHKSGEYFHFAVGARENVTDTSSNVSESYSGMAWATQFCSPGNHRGRLNGLTVTPLQNGSVEVRWTEPCESRFLIITGYLVHFYPCEVGTLCSGGHAIQTNETSVILAGLEQSTRYCFGVDILLQNSSDITFDLVPECIVTKAVEYSFPTGSVVGVVVGGIVLVVLIVILKRVVKRLMGK